ncbi:hypothetical protein Cantr_01001 [Candida viswanathii]|uniref:Anaphase-promoting complex subunit 4 n=1 Tax=Candida viswanathii TaxID=5486 RepID=A0A367YH18_9ASCO|nr:hypothetical protein Cantr_01001 [Candida viswanathii]
MKSSMVTTVYNGKLPSLLLADPNGVFTWCPHLNLIFVSMNKTSIWCYRINGERIYSINNKSFIKNIAFHNQFFCLSGVDNLIKIYNSNNGQLVKVLDELFENVKFIWWNATEYILPTSILPKAYNLVNDLNYLVINDDKCLTFNFNQLLTVKYACEISLQQQLNSDLVNQIYLADNSLVAIKFNVVSKELYTQQIIKVCQLISLIEYTDQHIKELQDTVAPLVQALDRYMSNLNSECEDMTVYLTDLLLTNVVPEFSKDFWLNQYGERGFKKMTKLASVYEQASRVVFQHLVSSMERIIVVSCDLIGISKWQHGMLSVDELQMLLANAKDQLKFYYRFIWDLQSERESFNEFLSWTKTIIDMLNDQEYEIGYSTTNVLTFATSTIRQCAIMKYFDFDTEVLASSEKTLMRSAISLDLSRISNYHSSVITVEKISSLHIPETATSLKLTRWDDEIIITYIQDSNLVLANLHTIITTVPHVLAFEHREGDLVALTETGSLLIINSSSCIPIPLPQTTFTPTQLKLNSSYGVLLDSSRQNYLIFRI